jgi:pyrroline-5-carboxylate reductase
MPTKTKIKETIGFVGGGNMAKAICEGMVRKGNWFFYFFKISIKRPKKNSRISRIQTVVHIRTSHGRSTVLA